MAHNIGALIREMRKAAGMSQMRLADKLGISYQQVQKYEKGASKLSVPRLMQVANIFGVPVVSLLEDQKGAKEAAVASNLSEEEAKLLMLFRRLRKKPRRAVVRMVGDIVNIADMTKKA